MPTPSGLTELPFEARGANRDAILAKDTEVLLEGPAGTGKSRAVLEKMYLLGFKYPGVRMAMIRKTRKSINQSIFVTFRDKVRPPDSPVYFHGGQAQEWRFPIRGGRRSVILALGTSDPEQLKSIDLDFAFINEGTELTVSEYELILSRLRNGVLPYQSCIVDCNPDAPSHWLNQRAEKGKMLRLRSRHEDNPAVTPEYLAVLDELTGVRYQRLRLGNWVAAEGAVYPEFNRDHHLIPGFRIPRDWPRFLSVDFGWNVFVCQWWALEPQSHRLILYREIYQGQRRVEQHAHVMFEQSQGEPIQALVTDWDAEDRETILAHWHKSSECPEEPSSPPPMVIKADKDIRSGIDMVKARLARSGGIAFIQDSLLELDQDLKERGKPTRTIDEFDGYSWDVRQSSVLGEIHREVPLKRDDHGMDAMRYLIKYIDASSHFAQRQLLSSPATMSFGSPVEMSKEDALLTLLRGR